MALADIIRKVFGAPTDSKKRRETIDAILPLQKTMTPPPASWEGRRLLTNCPGLVFEGDMYDARDEQARFTAQCCVQLVREHPEYALLGFTKHWMIVRREDLDKYASKDVKKKAMEDGVLTIRDNLPMH